MNNSIEILKPFAKALEQESLPKIQIIGGVASAALIHPDTIINVRQKEVIAPDDLYLSNIRSNGTLRDLDILVMSSLADDICLIKDCFTKTINGGLDPSIFGFKKSEVLERQINRPLGFVACRTFLSDRYELANNAMVKSLFPFSTAINPESLESWNLNIGDINISIPNPAMLIINYLSRSISGVRFKDIEKVNRLSSNIFSKAPELRDWALGGPAASQVELSLALRSLTPNKKHDDVLKINRPLENTDSLIDSELFMLPELKNHEKRQVIGIAALKANSISALESNGFVANFVQRHVEHRIGSIINND